MLLTGVLTIREEFPIHHQEQTVNLQRISKAILTHGIQLWWLFPGTFEMSIWIGTGVYR